MNGGPAVYSGGSRFLHWIIAALILLGLIPIGLTMVSLGDGMLKNFLYEVHKSFGMIVFTLAVMRVVVRVAQGFPPLPDSMPEWQKIAARATHLALYALILTVQSWAIREQLCAAPQSTCSGPYRFPSPLSEAWNKPRLCSLGIRAQFSSWRESSRCMWALPCGTGLSGAMVCSSVCGERARFVQ